MAKQSELNRAIAHLDAKIAPLQAEINALQAAKLALQHVPQPKRTPKPAKVAAMLDGLAADGR